MKICVSVQLTLSFIYLQAAVFTTRELRLLQGFNRLNPILPNTNFIMRHYLNADSAFRQCFVVFSVTSAMFLNPTYTFLCNFSHSEIKVFNCFRRWFLVFVTLNSFKIFKFSFIFKNKTHEYVFTFEKSHVVAEGWG